MLEAYGSVSDSDRVRVVKATCDKYHSEPGISLRESLLEKPCLFSHSTLPLGPITVPVECLMSGGSEHPTIRPPFS